MSDEYGVGELSGKRVPRSQQRDMLTHLKGMEQEAVKRLNRSTSYDQRRRAEQDLEGIQSTRHKVLGWDVDDE